MKKFLKKVLPLLFIAIVGLIAGISLHKEAVELAIGSRYEGCHEATLFLERNNKFIESKMVEEMCVVRDQSVREFVR